MLLAGNPTKKPPTNVNGANSTGLWDIDPQRIIIPIPHCPMGLVDKILESFKNWVNLDVELCNVDATEGARRAYRSAKDAQRHNATKSSLCHQFETVYRSNGIKKEHYHGGKFNGVNCIRIIKQSHSLLLDSEDS